MEMEMEREREIEREIVKQRETDGSSDVLALSESSAFRKGKYII